MARDTVIKATVDIGAKITDFQNGINSIQKSLNQIRLPSELKNEFNELFTNFDNNLKNIKSKTENNQVHLIDEKSIKQSFDQLNNGYKELVQKLKSEGVKTSVLDKDAVLLDTLNNKFKDYQNAISKADGEIAKQTKEYQDQIKAVKDLEAAQNRARRTALNKKLEREQAESNKTQAEEIGKQEQINLEAKQAELKVAQEALQTEKERLENLKAVAQETQKAQKGTARNWQWNEQGREYKAGIANLDQSQQAQDVVRLTEEVAAAEDAATKASAEREKQIERTTKALVEAQTEEKNANTNLTNVTEQYKGANQRLQELETTISGLKADELQKVLDTIDWSKFGVDRPVIQSQEEFINYIRQMQSQSTEAAQALVNSLKPALDSIKGSGHAARQGCEEAFTGAKKVAETQTDLERLSQRLVRFFSIDNAVRLFRRAVRQAVNTIKELDKAMTETAVVTEFSVADMWKTLPEYTKRANELGLAVKDVYQASTLYYQQGLKTNQVMQVTNATLRMARIASLDASDATDRMTNALRGFNMEINETNADNVADVYSKLAAISASNVDEISTAMTKVASLANSANMSFENTAAFLSQIIETTRESAETAGTALKTVVARFSEVKNLYSKGELLGETEEGEEIDVNKVSKALRTAGINLNEFLTGQKGLDEIFMELASRWDDLDIVQQRYIATMAAGSRQQSRFIALMSNYKRTQELTIAAQNASGASMEQYEKTLESVETKINRLKNAWNEFLMGIANDQFVRGFLDVITNILQAINKLTDKISGGNGLIKSIANIGIAIGGLKLGGTIIKALFGNPMTGAKGYISQLLLGIKGQSTAITAAGAQAGASFSLGFRKSLNFTRVGTKANFGRSVARSFGFGNKYTISANDLGIKSIDLSDAKFTTAQIGDRQSLIQAIDSNNGSINPEIQQQYQSLNSQFATGKIDVQQYSKGMKELGVNTEVTGEQAQQAGVQFDGARQTLMTWSTASIAAGSAFMIIGSIIDKVKGKSTLAGKMFKNVGIALVALGSLLPMVSRAFAAFGKDVTVTIAKIPIIGWIAMVITLLVALGTAIASVVETPKKKIEAAKEAFEAAKKAAEETEEAYNNLSDSLESIDGQETEIAKLTKGTKEWQQAVKEHNDQVIELIGTYKELNVVSKGGVLTFTNSKEVEELYQRRMEMSNLNQYAADVRAAEIEFEVDRLGAMKGTARENYMELASAINAGEIWDVKSLINYAEKNNMFSIEEEGNLEGNYVDLYKDFNDVYKEYLYDDLAGQASRQRDFDALANNFYVAIGNSAAGLAGLNEEQSQYIDTLVNSTALVEQFDKDEKYNKVGEAKGLVDALSKFEDDQQDQLREQYYDYIYKTTGTQRGQIKEDGSFTDSQGNNHTYAEYAKGFEAYLIQKQLDPIYKKLTNALNAFGKKGDDWQRAIARVFEDGGGKLTYTDLEVLNLTNVTDEATLNNTAEELFKRYAESMNISETDEDYEQQKAIFVDAIKTNALETYQAYSQLNNKAFGQFSTETIKSFNNNFKDYIQDLSKFGSNILDKFSEFGLTGQSQQEKAIKLLSGVDLSSKTDLQATRTQLEDYGIEIAEEKWDEFINFVIDRVGALDKLDLAHFRENISDIKKTIQDLKDNTHEQVFTQEEYDKIKPYVNEKDFQQSAYGVFYIGDDFESLGDKIQKAIGDGFAEVDRILQEKLGLEEVYEKAKTAGEDAAETATNNARAEYEKDFYYHRLSAEEQNAIIDSIYSQIYNQTVLRSVLEQEGTNTKLLEIPGLADLVDENGQIKEDLYNALSPEKIQDYLAQLEVIVGSKSSLESDEANLEIEKRVEGGVDSFINEIFSESQRGHYSTIDERTEQDERLKYDRIALKELLADLNLGEEIAQGLLGKFSEIDTREEVAETYNSGLILQRAKFEELDPKEVKDYANELIRLGKVEDNAIDKALDLSIAHVKVNKSLEQLISTSKDWQPLIGDEGSLGKGTAFELDAGQFKIYKEFKETVEDSLGIVGDLNDAFFESVEVGQLLGQIAEGSVEEQTAAYEQLVQLANESIAEVQKNAVIDFIVNPDNAYATTDEFITYVTDLITNVPDISIEALMNDSQFNAGLKAMMTNSGIAGEEIAKKLGLQSKYAAAGYDYIELPEMEYDSQWRSDDGGTPLIHKKIRVPKYSMTWEPIAKATEPPDFAGIMNRTGGGNGNSGKSGSGADKSEKEKLWKNPYDELYNLQEKINSALREREKLEHTYQDMLDHHVATGESLVQQSLLEISSLKQQLQLQKQMLTGRQRQMANVANEIFEDSEGNRTTLGAMGVTRYASYNASTGTISIDYDAINKITNENLGNAVEQYISRMEELRDQINDIDDTIEQIGDDIWEIQQRGKEDYLNFEERVYDAVVAEREKEIETLEKINDTVHEAANKTIQTIQDEISKERQMRENEKDEQNIRDKEMRLAYLQRDTSGANALEIQKLQKEISDDQQSYQDKIIDQTLQQMQEEADKAAEQRQAQIDIANSQLEQDKINGEIWNDVYTLIQDGINDNGVIEDDSELYKKLGIAENTLAMSIFGKENWKQELADDVAKSIQGLQNWTLSDAKNAGKLKLGDDTVLRYNSKKDLWWDPKSNSFVSDSDLKWDNANGVFNYERPQVNTSNNGNEAETKGSGSTSNGQSKVTYTVQKNDGPWQVAKAVYGSEAAANQFWSDVDAQLQQQLGSGYVLQPGQVVSILKRYAQGGLVNFTGPAWLDGSKSRPEMVLDAADTQNLITLKNILAQILNSAQSTNKNVAGGDNYFDIDIQADIDSDYDVDQLADRIKYQIANDAMYRNVNMISQMR